MLLLPKVSRVRLLLLNAPESITGQVFLDLYLIQALGLLGQLGIEGFELLANSLDHIQLALSGANFCESLQHLLLKRLHLPREEAGLRIRLERCRGCRFRPQITHLRSGITQIKPGGDPRPPRWICWDKLGKKLAWRSGEAAALIPDCHVLGVKASLEVGAGSEQREGGGRERGGRRGWIRENERLELLHFKSFRLQRISGAYIATSPLHVKRPTTHDPLNAFTQPTRHTRIAIARPSLVPEY